MSDRKLKNYDRYLQSLEMYIKASGLTIKYATQPGDGSYSLKFRRITVDPDLTETEELAVILHELGHSLDDLMVNKSTERALTAAYTASELNSATKEQRRRVLRCEKRAWKYARATAKKLNIPLGVWFDNIQAACLKDYKDAKK